MRIMLVAFIAIFFSLSVFAQSETSSVKDLQGWQGTKWGMTTEELQKQLGSKMTKRAQRDYFTKGDRVRYAYTDYQVSGLDIAGESFDAEFRMDIKTNRLTGVNVRSGDKRFGVEAESVFEGVEKALLLKYGPVGYADDKRSGSGLSRVRRWVFPTTTIELVMVTGYFNAVVVKYEPTSHKDADKL